MDHPPPISHGHAQTSAPPYAAYHHQAPPILPPSVGSYSTGYYQPYTPVSTAGHHHAPQYQHHPVMPTLATNPPASSAPPPYPAHTPDTTGGVAPPGHKPRLTGTVWEDEGTVCFQVEVRGICVARRQDNCFINGTKLLNVANMTRGRRDGILKSEKVRKVVKIGPMHLKGVWIPFERALEFANKEKITEQLYPLFVSNISPMLGQQFQQVAPSTRRHDAQQSGQPQSARTPQSQHAESPSMHQSQPAPNGVPNPESTAHSAAPPASSSRPELSRSHTFPTPPASATSAVGAHGQSNGSYNWDGSSSHALQLETGLTHTKSYPTTPTTTEPDQQIPSMHYPSGSSYDASRHMYSAPAQTSSYAPTQALPASSYAPHLDGHKKAKDEDIEHGREYASHAYSAPYSYGDQPHVSPELKSSPSHNASSGRGTPRSVSNQQPHWPSGYATPQQRQYSTSNLAYAVPESQTNGYSTLASYGNGASSSKKRGRDYDDDEYGSNDSAKRHKMTHDANAGFSGSRPALVQRQ
ncbi:MAG: hypothetical protein M1831_001200 [Alyxoria varia]|nr:MAG: hypothetical protein M1831_001200 [Alyxoria varia]